MPATAPHAATTPGSAAHTPAHRARAGSGRPASAVRPYAIRVAPTVSRPPIRGESAARPPPTRTRIVGPNVITRGRALAAVVAATLAGAGERGFGSREPRAARAPLC